MTRAQQFGALAALFTTAYLLALYSVLPVPFFDAETVNLVLPVLPWWMLVTFGAYSLASLGWGLFTFRDCPEAYNELLSEISLAKNDLRSKGVTVD